MAGISLIRLLTIAHQGTVHLTKISQNCKELVQFQFIIFFFTPYNAMLFFLDFIMLLTVVHINLKKKSLAFEIDIFNNFPIDRYLQQFSHLFLHP